MNATPRAATVKAAPGHGKLRVATLGEKAFTRLLGPVIDILARKAETSYDSANLSPPSSTSSIQASVIPPVSISTGPTFNDSFNTGTFNNSRAESMEVDDRARRDEQFGPGGEDRRGIRAGSAGK